MYMRHSGLSWYIGYAIWAILLCGGSVGLLWKIGTLTTQKQRREVMMITEELREGEGRVREEDVDKTIVEQQYNQSEKQ